MTRPYVVLGIDAGRTSGVALAMMGPSSPDVIWAESGRSTWDFRDRVAHAASMFAECQHTYLMVVYEKMFGRTHVIRGASKQVGMWIGAMERHVKQARMHEVGVHEWRHDIYGRTTRKTSSEWKDLAMQRALRVYGMTVSHDAAEAMCLAEWGLRSDAVKARVPKRPL